ncbi:uncharacterized protein LOC131482441 [Ochotona princeps]|uniref:uncharacterized protein LOC131482441 n=1 Tax=Ochotona princeps TaxID=9978 RepID=UPI002714E437|nr:uncharacterized protein LOC131482441 [Ochotona princeps]
MSSPSHTPSPSPTQSPSQSRSNNIVAPSAQQPYGSSGGSNPSPSPTRGGTSSRPPSHPPTPTTSQPSSRASSLTPSPHIQHVPRGGSGGGQLSTPPPSKSPSQSGLKALSRNPSLTPPAPFAGRSLSQSPATSASYIGPVRGIPSYIAPYVPRFLKEPPFFEPPTAPLPQNRCFPCAFPCPRPEPPPPPASLYFPLLPPPPHDPQSTCSFQTPPALFTPPSSLSYCPPVEVLLRGKPHVVPSVLPATFYTPFSRYYSQPRPRRTLMRRRPSAFPLPALPNLSYDSPGRSVHFYRGS